MIHPHTEVRYIDNAKGYGLFATRRIPCGTITWTLDKLDREITPIEMDSYEPQYREILLKYSFRNNKGNYIFCWDNGRYMNHSFNSNCCLTPHNFEIAVRDIEEGEELTDDYGYLNIIEPFTALSENCARTTVYSNDLMLYAEIWDEKLAIAFPELLRTTQPLKTFLTSEVLATVKDIIEGKQQMLAIRTCYYEGT